MREEIEAFIGEGGSDRRFDELAAALFAHQYETVPLYRRFCETRGTTPARVTGWREVPALPVDAFKHGVTGGSGRPHVFLSSGTSAGAEERSRHALSTLSTYRLASMTHFRAMVLPDQPGPMAVLVLGPTAASHPASSLGQMFSWCVEEFGNGRVCIAFDAEGTVDVARALDWLGEAAAGTAPVLVLAISSALSAVLTEIGRRQLGVRLPADSRIVDTGGGKAYSRPGVAARVLSPRGLLKAVWRCLHVPAYLCVNEYGMTEMLSQFYDDAWYSRHAGRLRARAKVGPPWVRTTIVDPTTLEPVAAGEAGLLRHFDLANWESVAALQTLDLGRDLGHGFELGGRAAGVERRGCSELLRGVLAG